MRRAWFVALLMTAVAAPAHAQFVVIDSGNLAQAVLIAERTVREYDALMAQYQTLVRMSQGLGNMEPYRIPTIPGTEHDVARWQYGGSWLEGLNTGDPTGSAYQSTIRSLESPGYTLEQLPLSARRSIEQAYATVEITDSVAQQGGNAVAQIRGYSRRLQEALDALQRDVVSHDPQAHDMTAVLDKVAAGSVIARREDMAANQLLSHALEQLLVRSKRLRDTEAATMNMRIGALQDGRTAGTSIVQGAADALRTWQQP